MRTFSFSIEIDQVLDELGDKQADFVKEAVIEKARREGLLKTLDDLPKAEPQQLSIGDRLRQRKRTFLDGSVDLSERSIRKQIAYNIVDERYQSQQSPQ